MPDILSGRWEKLGKPPWSLTEAQRDLSFLGTVSLYLNEKTGRIYAIKYGALIGDAEFYEVHSGPFKGPDRPNAGESRYPGQDSGRSDGERPVPPAGDGALDARAEGDAGGSGSDR